MRHKKASDIYRIMIILWAEKINFMLIEKFARG